MKWPPILKGNSSALTAFSDFLQRCQAVKTHNVYLSFLDDPREQKKLLAKLPREIATKWIDKALQYIESKRGTNNSNSDEENPPFKMPCDFIYKIANERSNPFLCLDEVSWEADCWRSTETKITKWKQRESNIMAKNRGSRTFMAKAIEEKPCVPFKIK